MARELINRIQRLRKKAGLNTTDDVKVEFKLIKDTVDFHSVLLNNEELLLNCTKRPIHAFSEVAEDKIIIDEEQAINDTTFNLRLLKI